MIDPYDEQSSGRIVPNEPTTYSIGNTFSDIEEMPAGGYNRLQRGVRYGKFFVLKGLKSDYADDETFRSMLRKEFEIMVQLGHPNIVRVYSLEEVAGVGLCIVMEYVDGMPLDQWLATKPSATARRRVAHQMLDAMSHWHEKQVVHRDLKPSNVLITRNGANVRVIDFGLSDADHYAILKEPAYTLSYASPEQIEGGSLDGRSDIYSFGRLLGLLFTPPHLLLHSKSPLLPSPTRAPLPVGRGCESGHASVEGAAMGDGCDVGHTHWTGGTQLVALQ